MKKIFACLLLVSGLMIGTAGADEPKGYKVTLTEGKIGTTDLTAGDYRLLVHREDMKAELMNLKTGDTMSLTGKVETAASKFERTEVHSEKIDGKNQIREIRIGGTKYRVDFRKTS